MVPSGDERVESIRMMKMAILYLPVGIVIIDGFKTAIEYEQPTVVRSWTAPPVAINRASSFDLLIMKYGSVAG